MDGATQLGFVFLEAEMRGGGGVVIDHAHFGLSEGVENGAVQFDEGTILPKSGWAGGVEAESASNFWKKVIAVFVGKVSGADLGFHIPATEGSRRKADATDFESHVGDDWKGNPAKGKGVEARGVGVADKNFLGGFFWGWKKTGFFSG